MKKAILISLSTVGLWGFDTYINATVGVNQNSIPTQSPTYEQELEYQNSMLISDEFKIANGEFSLGGELDYSNDKNNDKKIKFKSHFTEFLYSSPFGKSIYIDVGKKKLNTNNTFFYAPTDFLGLSWNPRDILSKETNDKLVEGKWMLNIEYISENYSVKLSALPKVSFDNSSGWSKLTSTQEEQYLLALSLVNDLNIDSDIYLNKHNKELSLGLNLNYVIGNSTSLYSSFAIFNKKKTPSIINDGKMIDESEIKGKYDLVLGSNIALDSSSTFILEYLYHGKNADYSEKQKYFKYANNLWKNNFDSSAIDSLNNFEQFTLSKDYLFLRYKKKFKKDFFLETIHSSNLSDGSGFFLNKIGQSSDDRRFLIGSQIFHGKSESEFGIIPLEWKLFLELEFFW